MNVTIVRGLPGSGKSTMAIDIAKKTGCLHIEADMFFIRGGKYIWKPGGENHKWCLSVFETAVRNGMDVVVSNTFTRMSEMRPYLDIAARFGASTRVIAMKGDYGNTHSVPCEVMTSMRGRWEDYEGEEVVGGGGAV